MKQETPLSEKLLDKSISLKERLVLKEKADAEMMNPLKDFNPDDFEPLVTLEEKELLTRKRNIPPKKLPTFGLKPKDIRIGQMIGMYESKQDIYLTFAHRCNEMQEELDILKEKLNKIEKECLKKPL
jgi:hypothetical protein